MVNLKDEDGYRGYWMGDEGDLVIGGVEEGDMTQEEIDSVNQAVTIYTKKQVLELLNKPAAKVKMTPEEYEEFKTISPFLSVYAVLYDIVEHAGKYPKLNKRFGGGDAQLELASLWGIYDRENPEETVNVVPEQSWYVRAIDNPNFLLCITDRFVTEPYGYVEDDNLEEAISFATREEANKWVTPVTETALLPEVDDYE